MFTTLLRTFFEVARQGGVTAAARQLGISQPTVSAQLRLLEQHYRVELFQRRNGRLQLTDAAVALMPAVEQLLQHEALLMHRLQQSSDELSGQLRIAATGPYYLLPLLQRFRLAYPHCTLTLRFGNSAEVLAALRDFRADLAVSSQRLDSAELQRLPLADSPLVLLVHRDDALARLSAMPCARLAHCTLLQREPGSATRAAAEALLARHGVRPQAELEIGSREAIREAVVQRFGCALIAAGEAGEHPQLRTLPLADGGEGVAEYVYVLAQRRAVPAIARFLTLLGE
ncbi:LysR substrate-binding domain-containing protein [Chitinilyticum litopenaei]|uniref:LysR substrate-binding domain-containing protein n=1 Tax=Chitinilyticum litopenaei TaxID=1121276 RepID=UPI000412DCE3|nr:LysR substrate-binding domain-containing protein [Chitinilyticum litopenaei]